MGIGNNIKRIRKENEIKQEALARDVGISSGRLSKYENEHHVPGIKIINRIAKALKVTVDSLLSDKIQENTNTQIVAEPARHYETDEYIAHGFRAFRESDLWQPANITLEEENFLKGIRWRGKKPGTDDYYMMLQIYRKVDMA